MPGGDPQAKLWERLAASRPPTEGEAARVPSLPLAAAQLKCPKAAETQDRAFRDAIIYTFVWRLLCKQPKAWMVAIKEAHESVFQAMCAVRTWVCLCG